MPRERNPHPHLAAHELLRRPTNVLAPGRPRHVLHLGLQGCRGIKEDVNFSFRAGDGVCPVPETPLTIETVTPTGHGAGLGCNPLNAALRPEPLAAAGRCRRD